MARGPYTLLYFAVTYLTAFVGRELALFLLNRYNQLHPKLSLAIQREDATLVAASVGSIPLFAWTLYIAVNMCLDWLWPQVNVAHLEAYFVCICAVLLFILTQRVVFFYQKFLYILVVVGAGLVTLEIVPFVCGPVSTTMGGFIILVAQQFTADYQVVVRVGTARQKVLFGRLALAVYGASYVLSWVYLAIFYAFYWHYMTPFWIISSIALTVAAPLLDTLYFVSVLNIIRVFERDPKSESVGDVRL